MNLVENVWMLMLTLAGLSSRKRLSVLRHNILRSKYIGIRYCVYRKIDILVLFFLKKISSSNKHPESIFSTFQWLIISSLLVIYKLL